MDRMITSLLLYYITSNKEWLSVSSDVILFPQKSDWSDLTLNGKQMPARFWERLQPM
jgi:hypothetical protein